MCYSCPCCVIVPVCMSVFVYLIALCRCIFTFMALFVIVNVCVGFLSLVRLSVRYPWFCSVLYVCCYCVRLFFVSVSLRLNSVCMSDMPSPLVSVVRLVVRLFLYSRLWICAFLV